MLVQYCGQRWFSLFQSLTLSGDSFARQQANWHCRFNTTWTAPANIADSGLLLLARYDWSIFIERPGQPVFRASYPKQTYCKWALSKYGVTWAMILWGKPWVVLILLARNLELTNQLLFLKKMSTDYYSSFFTGQPYLYLQPQYLRY